MSERKLKKLWKKQKMVDSDEIFRANPFVRAATAFRKKQYHGIIEILTEAVDTGMLKIRHCLPPIELMMVDWTSLDPRTNLST